MTTPTKYQLIKVGYKVYRNHRPYGKLGKYATKKWFMEVEADLWAAAAKEYITEWEKVRNSPK